MAGGTRIRPVQIQKGSSTTTAQRVQNLHGTHASLGVLEVTAQMLRGSTDKLGTMDQPNHTLTPSTILLKHSDGSRAPPSNAWANASAFPIVVNLLTYKVNR